MEIEKKISFSAYMRDDNGDMYVSFNGFVDEDGVPYTSYNISDNEKYLENVKEFRKNKSEFENEVFDEADKIVEQKEAEKEATTTVKQ